MMILQQTRGLLSSNDQLALDLPFAETKSLAARIGPTPTFTRGSGATYVGSDGLLHGVNTSTTSNTIGTGSKTFTLTATAGQDQLYRTGDAVDASNGSNSMVGTVTSYTPSTQVLVCNITSVTGSGTFTSWRIGYRGPRFDHNPANPTICRGLLIEEGRTNLTVRSDDFGASEWNAVGQRNLTVTANNTESPSGATNAELLTVGATTTVYQVVQNLPATGNITSGTAYTVSCYFKPNQVTRVSIWAGNPVTIPIDAMFDLTGAGSVVANAYGTASIQQAGNGWYRCIVTGTASATTNTTLRFSPVSGTSRTYAGNSVDSFWAWGSQLEAGSFATSYIPTTTSALARSADVCSITGANFTSFYNQSEGTLFADVTPQSIAQLATVLAVNSGSAQNQHGIYKTNAAFQAAGLRWGATSVLTGFVTQAAPSTGTDVAISRSKLSYAYKLDDFSFAYAGTIVGIDTSGTLPSPTTMQIGNRDGTLQINGHLAAIRFYKKRLPNAKLQSLTA